MNETKRRFTLPLTAKGREIFDAGGLYLGSLEDKEEAAALVELANQAEELEATFELRHAADMRAIKRWQEETGQTMIFPDHADLCVWLLLHSDYEEARRRGFREGVAAQQQAYVRDARYQRSQWLPLNDPSSIPLVEPPL